MLQIRGTLAALFLATIASLSVSCATADSTLPDAVVNSGKVEAQPQPTKVLQKKVEVGKLRPATPEDLEKLKSLDRKYQNAKSISMDLEKSLKLNVLAQERKSKGRLLIARGKLRMEIDKPDQSLVVVDKKNIWVVQYPPEELKGAALQVIRASANTKKGRSQSFIGLLVKGGITKYFKVLNTITEADGSTTYFLQPQAGTVEFERAQVTLDPKGQEIKQLKYWDELSNETTFKFRNVSFNKTLSANKFTYNPPKNADVTTY